ncbi:hypothetical protein H1R20_g1235, partial [Candolleomyces eurysporus]
MEEENEELLIKEPLERNAKGTKGLHETPVQEPPNDGKESHCRCCPEHSPPKPQLKIMVCGHKMGGRNLIVCIDGTANQFGEKNTNVVELYNLVMKKTDFDKTIKAAYQWLCDNYEDGDCIFLFGFSRGAFQVRTLSAMIHKVFHPANLAKLVLNDYSAYELYADCDADPKMAERFKRAFSREDVKVHFVGAWDTVSSIGVVRGKKELPDTTRGMTHVCYFRHALALDERRVKFLPEYACGGTMTSPSSGMDSDNRGNWGRIHPQVLEVWFPGSHSDIGGGNASNAGMNRSRPPMRWMALQAAELGLRIGKFERELLSTEQIESQESLTWIWKLFEILPFRRLTFSRRPQKVNSITYKPHLGSSRKIHEGQKIHCSFILGETTSRYIPKARPHDNTQSNKRSFWSNLRNNGLREKSKLLEFDAFYRAADAVSKLLAGEEIDDLLTQIVADGTGPQAWYDEVIETLRTWDQRETKLKLSLKWQLLRTTIDKFQGSSSNLKLEKWSQNPTLINDLLRSDSTDHRKVAQDFQHQFIKDVNCLSKLEGHSFAVTAVAISPDNKRIVSGSVDDTIRIWDLETGKQL